MPQIAQQDYILISPPLEELYPLDWVEGIVRIMRAVLGNTGMDLVLRHGNTFVRPYIIRHNDTYIKIIYQYDGQNIFTDSTNLQNTAAAFPIVSIPELEAEIPIQNATIEQNGVTTRPTLSIVDEKYFRYGIYFICVNGYRVEVENTHENEDGDVIVDSIKISDIEVTGKRVNVTFEDASNYLVGKIL